MQMRSTRVGISLATSLLVVAALAGCASNESSAPADSVSTLSGTLNGAGASSQATAQTAWVAGFQQSNPGVTINYDPTGSGAGRKSFVAGAVAFAGSDAAMTDAELQTANPMCATGTSAIDLPAYISPIAVAFNVPGVTSLNLDADTLAKIFSGAITTWNDPAIVALNPKASLPAATITAVHRSDNSGTTTNFTDYLAKAAPSNWTNKAGGDWPATLGGEGANGTSGVVDAISNGSNTIGYVDFSKLGKLNAVSIKVGTSFVAPSAAGAAQLVANSQLVEGRSANDFSFSLNRTTSSADEYPLVLVSYLVVCQDYKDAATAELVAAYAQYIVSDAGQQAAAEAAGSAPLTGELAAKVQAAALTIQ